MRLSVPMGNSVAIPVVDAIAENMLHALRQRKPIKC